MEYTHNMLHKIKAARYTVYLLSRDLKDTIWIMDECACIISWHVK